MMVPALAAMHWVSARKKFNGGGGGETVLLLFCFEIFCLGIKLQGRGKSI